MEQIGEALQRTIGKNIRAYRKEQGIRQNDFAKRVGTTSTTLSKIENGDVSIRMDMLEKIAEELGKPIQQIIFSDDVIMLDNNILKKIQNSD